jgi:hypothetical protein
MLTKLRGVQDCLEAGRKLAAGTFNVAFRGATSMADWPVIVMGLFEDGDVLTHETARTAFHVAFAGYYQVGVGALSRGRIEPSAQALDDQIIPEDEMAEEPEWNPDSPFNEVFE